MKKKYLLLFGAMVFIFLLYSGFCFKRARWLSNDEICNRAVIYLKENPIKKMEKMENDRLGKNGKVIINLEGNYCEIGDLVTDTNGLDFILRFTGTLRDYVMISYSYYYEAESGEAGEVHMANAVFSFSGCGDIFSIK